LDAGFLEELGSADLFLGSSGFYKPRKLRIRLSLTTEAEKLLPKEDKIEQI